jgi:hypothetical protein
MSLKAQHDLATREVEAFNKRNTIGTAVRYWAGVREGEGTPSRTCAEATVMGACRAVVWVDGHSGCIALSHVEIEPEAKEPTPHEDDAR